MVQVRPLMLRTFSLSVAAEGGHFKMVKIPTEAGAGIDLRPADVADGLSPLDTAATRGFLDLLPKPCRREHGSSV